MFYFIDAGTIDLIWIPTPPHTSTISFAEHFSIDAILLSNACRTILDNSRKPLSTLDFLANWMNISGMASYTAESFLWPVLFFVSNWTKDEKTQECRECVVGQVLGLLWMQRLHWNQLVSIQSNNLHFPFCSTHTVETVQHWTIQLFLHWRLVLLHSTPLPLEWWADRHCQIVFRCQLLSHFNHWLS